MLFALQVSRYSNMIKQGTIAAGEYVDWEQHDSPKRVRFPI